MDQSRNRKRISLLCLLLGLITLAIYWPSLSHDFITYDDQQYVTENPHVQAGLAWRGVVWAFESNEASNWHPVTWLSHMLDCQLYGLKPAGHHLTNLLLHIANTLLLFLLLNRLTGAVWRSAIVAALFAWHPLHVQSVAWVAERKDVLSACFWLLTLCAYVWYAARPRLTRYLTTLALFALALMAKPMAVTLPFLLLLLDYWPLRRIAECGVRSAGSGATGNVPGRQFPWTRLLWEKTPFFSLTVCSCVLTVWAQNAGHAIVPAEQLPLTQRLPHVLASYVEYIGKAIVPSRLAIFYPYTHPPVGEVIGAGVLLVIVTVIALKLASRRPYFLVGWLWFLGTLVPVIGLVQAGDQSLADRYSYLPFIGLFVMLVWGARDLGGRSVLMPAAAILVLLAAAVDCRFQLRYWKNTRTLFEHAERVTRNNYVAAGMLGSLLAQEGNFSAAIGFYSEALSYNPDFPEAHFYLGNALEKQGKLDEAMAEYAIALQLRPHFESAHIFLGLALAKQNKIDEARRHYLAVLQFNPDSAVAHNNLAKLCHNQGQWDAAIEDYTAALRIDPKLAPAHNNLGIVYLQQGRPAEGAAQLKEALRLDPNNLETEYNLALALNQLARWDEASELCAKVARSKPNDANLFYQWGLALGHLHQTKEALARFAHALLLNQDFPDALNALAWILATDPQPEFRNGIQAVPLAERACELTERKQSAPLLTLAAAYAEAGRFDEAISTAQAARELALAAGQKETAAKCESLLSLFQTNRPYRTN